MDDSYDASLNLKAKIKSASPIADASYADQELSLSELSVPGPSGRPSQQPFSLLARPSQPPEPDVAIQEETEGPAEQGEEKVETVEDQVKSAVHEREERLRQDLFVLRKLNAGFVTYNEALAETRSSTEVRISNTYGSDDRLIPISRSAFHNS